MKRFSRGLLAVMILLLGISALFSSACGQELSLGDYPNLFKKDTIIVIGENVSFPSSTEYKIQAAIVDDLKEQGVDEPILVTDVNVSDTEKTSYNLILIGITNSNIVLNELYQTTNVTAVTEQYPGKEKGILEIMPNPWNSSRAVLIVAGSDVWGLAVTAENLESRSRLSGSQHVYEIYKNTVIIGRLTTVGSYPVVHMVIEGDEDTYSVSLEDQEELWDLLGQVHRLRAEGYVTKYMPYCINIIDYEILED